MLIRFLFCISVSSLWAHSIVFIHLGNELPNYLPIAIHQARLFNKECPIYLIANESALKHASQKLFNDQAICIAAESLPRCKKHKLFLKKTRLDRVSRRGFWMYATERFFYLRELMKRYELSDVFHLEYDNMLYADVSHFLPTLKTHYDGKMAATFDNDARCIAGFIYVSKQAPLNRFLEFVLTKIDSSNNDMEFLAQFKDVECGAFIDHLPITIPSYVSEHPLVSPYLHTTKQPHLYFHYFDEFQSVFDAAAIGQFLGGIDPRNGPSMPGFINESCLFDPSLFQYEWILDEEERRVPWIVYGNEKYPIVNLHIHCKDLKKFQSNY